MQGKALGGCKSATEKLYLLVCFVKAGEFIQLQGVVMSKFSTELVLVCISVAHSEARQGNSIQACAQVTEPEAVVALCWLAGYTLTYPLILMCSSRYHREHTLDSYTEKTEIKEEVNWVQLCWMRGNCSW